MNEPTAATKLCAVSIFSSRVCEKGTKGCTIVHGAPSAAQGRELRLRTIKGLRELLREGTTMSPAADGLSVESNGYGLWLVAYDPQPISTAPISDEEILRRIEAREALRDAK